MTEVADQPLRAVAGATSDLDVAGVIRDVVGVARRNLIPVILVTALFGAAPAAAQAWFMVWLTHIPKGDVALNIAAPLAYWLMLVLAAALLQAALTTIVLADAQDRKADFGAAAAAALSAVPGQAAIKLLATLAAVLGMLLLVVPGIILSLAFSVAAPAGLSERASPLGALKRSRDLTRNFRARIFGLYLCLLLAVALVEGPLILLSGAGLGFFTNVAAPQRLYILPLANLLLGWILPIGAAVLYLRLTEIKGSLNSTAVGRVFD